MKGYCLQKFLNSLKKTPEYLGYSEVTVNSRSIFGNSPLHSAVTLGNKEAVLALLNAGADPSAVGLDGFTPLHVAVDFENQEIVNILLMFGASTEIRERQGRTAPELAECLGFNLRFEM